MKLYFFLQFAMGSFLFKSLYQLNLPGQFHFVENNFPFKYFLVFDKRKTCSLFSHKLKTNLWEKLFTVEARTSQAILLYLSEIWLHTGSNIQSIHSPSRCCNGRTLRQKLYKIIREFKLLMGSTTQWRT